jgi:hypothetical protein
LSLSALSAALRKGGRQRNIERPAREIQTALRASQLQAPGPLAAAYGAEVKAAVAVISEMTRQIAALETDRTDPGF